MYYEIRATWLLGGLTREKWLIKIFYLIVQKNFPFIFLDSIDASIMLKIIDKICKMLNDSFKEVSRENIVQIITYNVVNYKSNRWVINEKQEEVVLHLICNILHWLDARRFWKKDTILKDRKITMYIYLGHIWFIRCTLYK